MRLAPGQRVRARDGRVVAKLEDVIIDPVERRVSHLVVRPPRHDDARLVEIERVVRSDNGVDIALECTEDELYELPSVDDFAFIRLDDTPAENPDWDVGVTNVVALPTYESTGVLASPIDDGNIGFAFDRVPKGEVEIRRSSGVLTTDGRYIGEVDGFIVDRDEQITHLLLERGHLWRRREVEIPVDAVAKVEMDRVTVSLSESELGKLPARRIHRWLALS